jgi:uncharacterized protein YjiS (DUF1127 family)
MIGSTFESRMLAVLGLGTHESWGSVLAKSIKRRIAQFRTKRRLRRDALGLLDFDDHLLADIGLNRCELMHFARYGTPPLHNAADNGR